MTWWKGVWSMPGDELTDVRLVIARAEHGTGDLLVSLHAPTPEARQGMQHQLPVGDLPDLSAWSAPRAGSAPAGPAAQPIRDLRDRLLGPDLVGQLSEVLAKASGDDSVRLEIRLDPRGLAGRADLAEVPLELLPFDDRPVGLNRKLHSVFYSRPGGSAGPGTSRPEALPLRVLLVRSSPVRAGGPVPAGLPLRTDLLEGAAGFEDGLPTLLEIDVLTSELAAGSTEGRVGAPDYEQLRDQLSVRRYQVLVFLGHGVAEPGSPPGLAFEQNGPDQPYRTVGADLLEGLGRTLPPVVLLVACRSAAPGDDQSVATAEDLALDAEGVRAQRGLAQALVERGLVDLAVGMRHDVDTESAQAYLATFFKHVMNDAPGDVESALQAGRLALQERAPALLGWTAPMVYRPASAEPVVFPGLAEAIGQRTPDESQTSFTVQVLDERRVRATVRSPNRRPESVDDTIGAQFLRGAISVMETWLRRSRANDRTLLDDEFFDAFGGLLYRLLFTEKIDTLFEKTRKELGSGRLLVRLSFEPDARELVKLPWEYLCAPVSELRDKSFSLTGYGDVSLVLSRRARLTAVPVGPPRVSLEAGKLRILVVSAEGNRAAGDKAVKMRESLGRLGDDRPALDVQAMIHSDPDDSWSQALANEIERVRPHVLHLAVPGKVERAGQQILVGRSPTGRPSWMQAAEFAAALVRSGRWRQPVVFLQLTDWVSTSWDADLAEVAPELVKGGVRAVVAMRYPITDAAALDFCERFYPALADGKMVDVAVQDAMRHLIARKARLTGDRLFGTPVFYIQDSSPVIAKPRADQKDTSRLSRGAAGSGGPS